MPTPREIDWFLRSEMAEFFLSSLIGQPPVPFDGALLALFHVFLKLAPWPSLLGLEQGRNRSWPAGRCRCGNRFLFAPMDYPHLSATCRRQERLPRTEGSHEQDRDIVRLAVFAAVPVVSSKHLVAVRLRCSAFGGRLPETAGGGKEAAGDCHHTDGGACGLCAKDLAYRRDRGPHAQQSVVPGRRPGRRAAGRGRPACRTGHGACPHRPAGAGMGPAFG